MFPFFKMSPLNVEKIESSKLFVIQNYWRDKQKKITKSKNFIPPFLNKKPMVPSIIFLMVIISNIHVDLEWINVWFLILLFFLTSLTDFDNEVLEENEEFCPFFWKACVPIFCQVYFSLLAPRAIYFVSPWTFLLFLRNNKCYVLLVCDFT